MRLVDRTKNKTKQKPTGMKYFNYLEVSLFDFHLCYLNALCRAVADQTSCQYLMARNVIILSVIPSIVPPNADFHLVTELESEYQLNLNALELCFEVASCKYA